MKCAEICMFQVLHCSIHGMAWHGRVLVFSNSNLSFLALSTNLNNDCPPTCKIEIFVTINYGFSLPCLRYICNNYLSYCLMCAWWCMMQWSLRWCITWAERECALHLWEFLLHVVLLQVCSKWFISGQIYEVYFPPICCIDMYMIWLMDHMLLHVAVYLFWLIYM